jgi:hypothetical protein
MKSMHCALLLEKQIPACGREALTAVRQKQATGFGMTPVWGMLW